MKPLHDRLSTLLASTYALMLKHQFAHWNVRGTEFGPLHELFQAQYEDLWAAVDVIAEIIVALDGVAVGDFNSYGSMSLLADFDAKQTYTPDAFLAELVTDHDTIREYIATNLTIDGVPVDVTNPLEDRATAHRKAAWLLKASRAQA